MAKISKRWRLINEKLTFGKSYAALDALSLLKSISEVVAKVKFVETVDVAINLGIDAKKSDQAVRGATLLPNGTGKQVRVAVFAQGNNAILAKQEGADIIGFEDLAESIKAGNMDFDVVIATPDAMRLVGQLGQVLGPRGLMPNPKVGTVTTDVAVAVRNAKGGQVRYRTDKGGIIHCPIGKINFTPEALKQNLEALLSDLKKARPAAAKGVFIKRITISSTMGPGLVVDHSSLAE